MAPWFGPKSRYDTGIASWQGLLATVLFLLGFFYLLHIFQPAAHGWPDWTRPASIAGYVVTYGFLVWAKYDREPD